MTLHMKDYCYVKDLSNYPLLEVAQWKVPLKVLSHEMDLASEDMHDQFWA